MPKNAYGYSDKHLKRKKGGLFHLRMVDEEKEPLSLITCYETMNKIKILPIPKIT